jgi:nitric oxide dioxygenase
MLAMFNTLAKGKGEDGKREVTWIHGARGKTQHAFGEHVRNVVNDSDGRIKSVVFYSGSKGSEIGIQGQDFDIHGRVDLDRIDRTLLHFDNAQFYVCGPDKVGYGTVYVLLNLFLMIFFVNSLWMRLPKN